MFDTLLRLVSVSEPSVERRYSNRKQRTCGQSNEKQNAATYTHGDARTTDAETRTAIVQNRHSRVLVRIRSSSTYCDIGVYFVLLPIFTDEPAAKLVHARGHYLKPLMALGEDGFERFDFLLESVQTSHLRNGV